ncbi:MarR family transcriptional regulator [Sphingomonas histidinilytica]|nr:MarR family transcriptional regulator [Rhizorhabdus histidinilytica]
MPKQARHVPPAQLADRLRPLLLQLSRQLRREAQKSGLSPIDSQILMAIRQNPGAGVSELAQIEQMSRPTMSVHVKRLEASGWIERAGSGHAGDKRRVALALSDAGSQALAAVRRSRTDWLVNRLTLLTPDEIAALNAAVAPLDRLVRLNP